MAELYSGVGAVEEDRMLQRIGTSFEIGNRLGEMAGMIRIRTFVLLKSCSEPSVR